MNKGVITLIFVGIVFVVGGYMYLRTPDPIEAPNGNEPEQVFCTADAQLCPDGSYVGRSGPNCEFDPCPIPEGVMMEDGTIQDANN